MPDPSQETPAQPLVGVLALIGAGLIGSSIARAARQKGLAGRIVLADARDEVLQEARRIDLADAYHVNPADAAREADLVVLCVPVGAMGALAETVCPFLKPGAVVSDVGSVKASVVEAVGRHVPASAAFVPGHPIAGTEKSGPAAGFASLFENRWCILTPAADCPAKAQRLVTEFWEGLGSRVAVMDPAHHDLVLAVTSHLPHLIAYNIVGTAADLETVTKSEVVKYSASGFRDFTRIAASDPIMWRDVFLANKDAVLEMLGRFTEDLASLQRAIRWGDGEALEALFTRTREIRRNIVEAGQDTDAPNFGRDTAAKG